MLRSCQGAVYVNDVPRENARSALAGCPDPVGVLAGGAASCQACEPGMGKGVADLKRAMLLIGSGLLWAALLAAAGFAAAQGSPSRDAPGKVGAETTAADNAAVVFSNRTILVMRGSLLGFPPAERATRAEEQIAEALKVGGAAEVTTKATSEGTAIFVDGRLVFLVTRATSTHSPAKPWTPR